MFRGSTQEAFLVSARVGPVNSPEPLTEPDVNLSIHQARVPTRVTRPLRSIPITGGKLCDEISDLFNKSWPAFERRRRPRHAWIE